MRHFIDQQTNTQRWYLDGDWELRLNHLEGSREWYLVLSSGDRTLFTETHRHEDRERMFELWGVLKAGIIATQERQFELLPHESHGGADE